jgi:hypothetical protein
MQVNFANDDHPTQPNQTKPNPTNQLTAAEFAPDGATLATGSADCSVILWEVASGRAAAIYVADSAVTCLAFAAAPPAVQAAGGAVAAAAHTLLAGYATGRVHLLCGLPAAGGGGGGLQH